MDDYYLNLLDWGNSNVLSIALGNTIYLWTASKCSVSELTTIDEDLGPVTSGSWAPDGRHIAVGLNSLHIQLWDSTNNRLMARISVVGRDYYGVFPLQGKLLIVREASHTQMMNNAEI